MKHKTVHLAPIHNQTIMTAVVGALSCIFLAGVGRAVDVFPGLEAMTHGYDPIRGNPLQINVTAADHGFLDNPIFSLNTETNTYIFEGRMVPGNVQVRRNINCSWQIYQKAAWEVRNASGYVQDAISGFIDVDEYSDELDFVIPRATSLNEGKPHGAGFRTAVAVAPLCSSPSTSPWSLLSQTIQLSLILVHNGALTGQAMSSCIPAPYAGPTPWTSLRRLLISIRTSSKRSQS